MKLTVEWHKAKRNDKEAQAICDVYRERLLDLFTTADRAYASHEEWHRMHKPPIHPWTTYNAIARIDAGKVLSPGERKDFNPIVKFEKE